MTPVLLPTADMTISGPRKCAQRLKSMLQGYLHENGRRIAEPCMHQARMQFFDHCRKAGGQAPARAFEHGLARLHQIWDASLCR